MSEDVDSRAPAIEFDNLGDYLKALANPNRLELLYQLRFPRTVGEISLTPKRSESMGNPDRLISRQAVERHLNVLEDIQVIHRLQATREGRPVDEYVVNHASLFGVVEELRKLTLIQPHAMVDALATQGAEHPRPPSASTAQGPHLILVRGVWEGSVYPLEPRDDGATTWIVGRREGCDVRLDYDPYVSQENTRVLWDKDGYVIEDAPESRNGTHVNYEPLPRGGRATLKTGDLVGVGRSLLLFRDS